MFKDNFAKGKLEEERVKKRECVGKKREKSSETMQNQSDRQWRTYKHENENVPERNRTKIEQTLQTHIKRQVHPTRSPATVFRFAHDGKPEERNLVEEVAFFNQKTKEK